MKLNITKGLFLIGAIALSSCSTQNKMASSYDDVYNNKAVAGDPVVYAAKANNYRHDDYSASSDYGSDYYNYDSYTARLNRFYNSPFGLSYYDNLYYGSVSPYYNGLGLGLGLGLTYGTTYYGSYGYTSTYYNNGFYNPYYNYSGYNPYGYGTIYGYNNTGYGGVYAAYNPATLNTPKPYRGAGIPSGTNSYGSGNYYPPATVTTRPQRTSAVTPNPNNPVTVQQSRPQPAYQPQPVYQQPQPANNTNTSSGNTSSSSGSGNSNSGGGGRPIRP